MRRKLALLLVIGLLFPYFSYATPLDFNGGVHNEHRYEEMVFITGKPIKFTGTYTHTERDRRDDEINITYRFNLTAEGEDEDGEVEEYKLDRNVRFTVDASPNKEIGQTTNITELTSYKETIRIGDDRYELDDYQFSKSDVIDNRPASDFYEGNIRGRKYYTINRNDGTVTVSMSGGNVGYENFWGSTETQIIDHTITYDKKGTEDNDPERWTGTYSHQVSDSLTESLRYSGNNTSLSSIGGGHVKTTNQGVVSRYNYSLPEGRGSISLNMDMIPKVERLIVPKFRDVNGHWAEEDIKKLYSLNVFDDNSSVFSPNTPMIRLDFTKAVIRASDIRVQEEETRRSRRSRKDEEPSYFRDIRTENEEYKYVKSGVDKGIIEGISKDFFGPEDYLTRAQAVTILVRALGYESKAPNPGYITGFSDDYDIPNWAKDSIYMGKEIGLLSGDSQNRANPNDYLTRAEASTLIINYLKFLEKDLQRDYRDNILKYN